MRLRNGAAALLVLLASSCASTEDSDTSRLKQCEELRDHLVELRLASSSVDMDAHRSALREALGTTFVDRCMSITTAAQVQCALHAETSAAALACTQEAAAN